MSSSSLSSRNWQYDVFTSFRGEDVRQNFLSHFMKELDRKLISVFKDMKIEKSQSLDPVLRQAIKDSRIAVVLFSQKYASSSWCLNELLEIVKCKKEFGQLVIPVFYGLDPSHVRKQTGEFGKIFEETCYNKTEEQMRLWRQALTDVANLVGFHSHNWDNEAKLIEDIITDILDKLNVTPSKDFENLVGIEDHIAKMSLMLDLKSTEVKMVGIWGLSGIGKTTIARVLFNQISRHFQGRIYIDRGFISKSREDYRRANPIDYNMRLHLQANFLSELLDKEGIKVDHLGAVREKLKHKKVLVFIDDLDDQVVLDALAGGDEWFGPGSRIIVITKDKRLLEVHGISTDHIYRVGFPSKRQALEMFCRSAFEQKSPPDGFMELTTKVAARAGGLPLGLEILGKVMRSRNKEDWTDMLSRLQKSLNGDIEKTLRVGYDDLESREDKTIFRHIACFFKNVEVNKFKLMLEDSDLDVNIGLKNLANKSLISVIPSWNSDIINMHCLVEQMGKEIVCAQSDEPGQREFLIDSKDICSVLEDNTGTKNILGISLDLDKIDELRIDEKAFKGMHNLRFLRVFRSSWRKEFELYLPERFDYFPTKLKLLSWPEYPMKYMPSKFRPENLVELRMPNIMKLEKLWQGVKSLTCLKVMDLSGSKTLKEIPNLSKATNLETLDLQGCSSLVEVSTIQYLKKPKLLNMSGCSNVETLPTLINLQSLEKLNLSKCSQLKILPDIPTNIVFLYLDETMLEEFPSNLFLGEIEVLNMDKMKRGKLWEREQPLPLMTMLSPTSSFQNLTKLVRLGIRDCVNLETLPTGINFQCLFALDLTGCSRLRTFPNISTNMTDLYLARTGIEEVPWWIENFSKLRSLDMRECKNLIRVSLNIFKLKSDLRVDFSECWALTEASWINDSPSEVAMAKEDNLISKFPVPHETFSSLPSDYCKNFRSSFTFLNLDPEAILNQRSITFKTMTFLGEEVPSYFTHRSTGTSTSLTNIPLLPTHLSQPFFRYRVCAVLDFDPMTSKFNPSRVFLDVTCRFKSRFGSSFDSSCLKYDIWTSTNASHLFILDCCIPLNKDNVQLRHLNYDCVDMQIDGFRGVGPTPILKGWGVRILEDWSSAENRLGTPNTLPHVCEADDDNMVNQTEHNDESIDSNVETEKRRIS